MGCLCPEAEGATWEERETRSGEQSSLMAWMYENVIAGPFLCTQQKQFFKGMKHFQKTKCVMVLSTWLCISELNAL